VVLDTDTCYRALEARDRRFEGQFFVGVRSTGVYCRPGCPAPMPKRRNVSFFACAAAAESAGYRPCLRCRPDALPGSPAWNGTHATVARALRLIEAGGLDEGGVESLAERLGVGTRHLRRLFHEQLGTSPVAVARTRRAHFARKLIEETGLSMTDVAASAGFGSLRSFNTTMRATFQRRPSDLRDGRTARGRDAGVRLRLPFREPFDWDGILGYLRDRATAGVESVDGDAYRRSVSIDGRPGLLAVRPAGAGHLELRLTALPSPGLMATAAKVSRMFQLDADTRRIAAHLRSDALLRRALRGEAAPRVPVGWDPFELAVRAVLGQQVSVKGATTLAGRLVAACGTPLPEDVSEGSVTHLFPSPADVAEARVERIGIPGARAEALRGLAVAVRDGRIRLDGRDPDAFVEELTALPGIGDWTAQYVAMRGLGEPDAFPAGDLGVRRALARDGRLPSVADVRRRAEAWRPWRAHAAVALWRSGIGG
jgi:AraC family transcriptional regulator of adaptative response / DNA-3-methyladenine glycosylase II